MTSEEQPTWQLEAEQLWQEITKGIGWEIGSGRSEPSLEDLAAHLTRCALQPDKEFARPVGDALERYMGLRGYIARLVERTTGSLLDIPGQRVQMVVDVWLDELAKGNANRNAAVPPTEDRNLTCLQIIMQQQAWQLAHRQPDDPPVRPVLQPLVEHWFQQGERLIGTNVHKRPLLPETIFIQPQDQPRLATLIKAVWQRDQAAKWSTDQPFLPGLEPRATSLSLLPLQMYDLGNPKAGRKKESAAAAAPMALRLWISAILNAPRDHWGEPMAYRVTLRDFLAWFYDFNVWRPSRGKYRPLLARAMDALHSYSALIPFENHTLRHAVMIEGLPEEGPGELDRYVEILVRLPRGSARGPQVDRLVLRHVGLKSAVAYRGLLNLSAQWFEPGRTHFKDNGRWWRINDPDNYRLFTDDEKIQLFHPLTHRKNRGEAIEDAHTAIALLDDLKVLRLEKEKPLKESKLLPPLNQP